MKQNTKRFAKVLITGTVALLTLGSAFIANFASAQSGAQSGGAVAQSGGAVAQSGGASGTGGQADTVMPSDVPNVKATPGDSEIQLTWDAATDNIGVTSYKIYRGTKSVKTTEDRRYDLPVISVKNVKAYVVKNLTNGQKYFFSITAVDAAGNESDNYSDEVSATPAMGLRLASIEDDGKAPQVKEVKVENSVTVLVVFSEPVKLPEERPPSAFTIEKAADKKRLEVQKAEIDSRDETGKTVVLTTAMQEEKADYVLTAGLEIKDYFDNPIVSGTSDTGSFKGSGKKKEVTPPPPPPSPPPPTPPASGDKEPPVLVSASADFSDRIALNFSEKITLPDNPKDSFSIVKKGTEEHLAVNNVSLSVDEKTVYLTTAPQQAVEYEVRVSGVKDLAGNVVAATGNKVSVTGKTGADGAKDLIPPEEVTKLIARIKNVKTNLVELRWEPSKNSAKDLANQNFYQSNDKDGKAFGAASSLGPTATAVEVENLQGNSWYTFKVTTKDTAGNESKGAVTSIYLPKTGPGLIAAGLTSVLMGLYSRRRKKN